MDTSNLNECIISRGRELYALIADEKPSLFNTAGWMGKIMEWSMRNERFKSTLFRFVDVFPTLTTSAQLTTHIREYFGEECDLPPLCVGGAKMAGRLGSLGGMMLDKAISANIHEMARQFIIGETADELLAGLRCVRRDGFAAVIDVLGEATLSTEEAETYLSTYLKLLELLNVEQNSWEGLPGQGGEAHLDWGNAPRVNVAVKPTALFCLANPQDFEGSVEAILGRMRRITALVVELQGFLCIDMESYRFKAIILEVYRRLKLEYRAYPHIALVLQAYLKDTDRDLDDLLAWARQNNTTISVRLVKGAYWDYETVNAGQLGWVTPVRTIKAETDAAFERQSRMILENHDICYFGCASHNIRSIAAVLEIASRLRVPSSRYEFQMLYGMAEPVRRAVLTMTGRVRLYCPYGDLVPGMGYLVRRLLENSSNESFLRQSFVKGSTVEQLLADPLAVVEHEREKKRLEKPEFFTNEPSVNFTRLDHREAFPAAIATLRGRSGRICPLYIDGKEIRTGELIPSFNPARPSELLGQVCQAGISDVKHAIAAAEAALPGWRDTVPHERAAYMIKAAAVARSRIFELAALQVLEIGKQWDQAHADVAEAIDFLEYYAREMIRLGQPQRLGHAPGELNHYFYEPKGVAAVIAPWNFPLAISIGMTSAAIVTGNTVLYKPSSLTPLIGYQLVELFREAGLPEGVFNFIPGRSSIIGDFLVDHPAISLIAFTGSMEVGLRIVERAARVHPGQVGVKKVIAEMGGKNAIIVDADADLDEAVPQVLASAFAFQGQKCSACSRVIVLDTVHDRFVARLIKAARAWRVGSAEDPSYAMGAVADAAARSKILEYIELGRQEGTLLYESAIPEGDGYWVPLTIIGAIRPEHRLAQEEVFGPLLAVMRAADFDQAIQWANSTRFALTGGIFSRSPGHIERSRREFRVGNLYINRGITGALVERQPFGGSQLSGVGSKAGGPDYLLQFMDPRVVTENTMRRGFAPAEG